LETKPSHDTAADVVRSGVAEDEELLALLRGVSSASSASRRFQSNDDNDNENIRIDDNDGDIVPKPNTVTATTTTMKNVQSNPPPQQVSCNTTSSTSRSGMTRTSPICDNTSIVRTEQSVVTHDERLQNEESPNLVPSLSSSAPSHNNNNTAAITTNNTGASNHVYQGERGGVAEDEELLALLRGVSSASSASRFRDEHNHDDDDNDNNDGNNNTMKKVNHVDQHASIIPKLNGSNRPGRNPQRPSKNSGTSTIRQKLESDRIRSKESVPRNVPSTLDAQVVQASQHSNSEMTDPSPNVARLPIPPPLSLPVPATSSLTTPGIAADSSTISHHVYQGERGGIAEDEELLALLRGVSSASANRRFRDEDDTNDHSDTFNDDSIAPTTSKVSMSTTSLRTKPAPVHPTSSTFAEPQPVVKETISLANTTSNTDVSSMLDPVPQSMNDALLPEESILTSLTDKNWKVRCQAYDTLSFILRDHVQKSSTIIDSDCILSGLDTRVQLLVEDTNAGALDKALEFCNLYAEHCSGAGSSDIACRIVTSMIQKNCFSSRPGTLLLSNTLTLKLMEVGVDGKASIHSIVEVLLNDGLASKKPKVIQASASLILDAIYHFGAASLPLAALTNAAPKMLSHSNAAVRDCCIKILAEICRALGGSKAPIQNVVDGMKKAQLSELDTQLSEQPEPTPIRTGLRSSRDKKQDGVMTSAPSPTDAIATLHANAKELEAQRYAALSAVNIIAAIEKTEYAEQIQHTKWSEKVAALDKVLECGGEKPYKLLPPSSLVNYSPLVTEMKKLLAHTHFVVCSRAIQVLSMIAEGVGDKIYPHLRPTLTPLLQLSKDKKLTTEVSNGLDVFFGNVLSFDSILEHEDAIPSMVNEKTQKNALARATALTFLQRCVDRQSSAGPKGMISTSHAAVIATLCCNKLDDSDASVRKVSLSVLEALLRTSGEADTPFTSVVEKVLEQLRLSNPRAYKTLTATTSAVETKENRSSNTTSLGPNIDRPETTTSQSQPTARVRSAAPSKRPPSPAAPKPESRSTTTLDVPTRGSDSASLEDRLHLPRFEEAMIHVTSLGMPQWDASEDDGGILAGLKGTSTIAPRDYLLCYLVINFLIFCTILFS
jgi:hypothetical protein